MMQKWGIVPIPAPTVEYVTSVIERWTLLLQLSLLKTAVLADMTHNTGWKMWLKKAVGSDVSE